MSICKVEALLKYSPHTLPVDLYIHNPVYSERYQQDHKFHKLRYNIISNVVIHKKYLI